MSKLPYAPLDLIVRFTEPDPEVADFLSGDELHFLTCWLIEEREREAKNLRKAPCGCHKSPSGAGWCSAHGTLGNGPFDGWKSQHDKQGEKP